MNRRKDKLTLLPKCFVAPKKREVIRIGNKGEGPRKWPSIGAALTGTEAILVGRQKWEK